MMKSLIAKLGLVSFVLLGVAAGANAGSQWGPTPEQQKRHLELFHEGQLLWPIYCNHCHNARNPAEFAPYQWDQIIMHMRTMENLPPKDEAAILEYLKTAR
ncbi:MAG TPA: hypothetical protein VJX23_17230 [Candidatus Binataceae bacterium]|nr:hypothetical protein [Candidatus Binataceae bacterium]